MLAGALVAGDPGLDDACEAPLGVGEAGLEDPDALHCGAAEEVVAAAGDAGLDDAALHWCCEDGAGEPGLELPDAVVGVEDAACNRRVL